MKTYVIRYKSHNEANKPFTAEYWLHAESTSEARTLFMHEAREGNLDYPNDGIESIEEQ